MSVVFFIPLVLVTLWESQLDAKKNAFMKNLFDGVEEGEGDDPANQDPSTDHENGLQISKTPFEELVKAFPNTYQSAESSILHEIRALSARIDELSKRFETEKTG